MKVLMIGRDPTLFEKNWYGDFKDRVELYSEVMDMHMITTSRKYPDSKKLKVGNAVVYPVPFNPLLYFPFCLWEGFKIIRKEKIDAIVTQDAFLTGLIGFILSKLSGIPLVVQVFADFFDNYYWISERKVNHFLNAFGKWLVRNSDAIKVETERMKSNLLHLNKNIYVVPIFLFSREFKKPKEKMDFGNFGHIVLFAGRFAKQKNLPNLINAAKYVVEKHPDTGFVMVGGGPEEAKVRSLISSFGLERNFIFPKPSPQIEQFYYSSDILALSSNYEGMGRVVPEALSCGIPVAMTDMGSAREIVKNGKNGFFVERNKPKLLAEAINKLLESEQLRKKMSKNAVKSVEYLRDPNLVLKGWKKMLGEVAGRNPS